MLQRLVLLGCIVFFSGSVVILGARDLRESLRPFDEKQATEARKLVDALRGDALFKWRATYNGEQNLPQRQSGSYLPDYDKQKLKQFLFGLMGGSPTPGAVEQAQPAAVNGGNKKQGEKEGI